MREAVFCVVLVIVLLLPVVAGNPFPRQPKLGDTITVDTVLNNSNIIYWDTETYVWPTFYFYADLNDVPSGDEHHGTWRHVTTYAMNATWTVTYNKYLNFSDDTVHPFTIDYLKVEIFDVKQTRTHVPEGDGGLLPLNTSISGSPAVTFQLVNDPNDTSLYGVMFITEIRVNMTFLTTYTYWYWQCGGVVSNERESGGLLLALSIIGVGGAVFICLRRSRP